MRIDDVVGDLTYAVARLRRAPLFVAVVTLTFALGIGVNVAMFSVFNATVLRPLPFSNASRLVAIDSRITGAWHEGPLSSPDIGDLRAQLRGVDSIAGITSNPGTLMVDGVPKSFIGAAVSSTFFRTIAATPQIGRFFEPSDVQSGRHSMVISDHLWRSNFNAALTVVGKTVKLDGVPYSIVGVSHSGAQLPNPHPLANRLEEFDYVTAVAESSAPNARGGGVEGVVASLAPNTTVAQLNAELGVVAARLQLLYPQSNKNTTFFARPLAEQLRSPIGPGLLVALFAVFGILLIASANVANLIGARWSARESEVAIRRALGASTRRIAAQLFIETGVLATCGGIAGVVFAMFALQLISHTTFKERMLPQDIAIDLPALLYALLMVGVTTSAAGLAPVLALGRTNLQLVLNSAGRGGDASRGGGIRSALVVLEIALALALVIASGLVVRSYVNLLNTPLGIRSDGVYASFPFRLPEVRYRTDDSQRLADQQLLSHVEALPGVDAAALALVYPLSPVNIIFAPELFGTPCGLHHASMSKYNSVSPGYFRALGIQVFKGRPFTASDNAAGVPVTIANQAFVDTFLHGGNAVGQRVRGCGMKTWTTIVGVVGNVRLTLRAAGAAPTLYWPIAQNPAPLVSVVVHMPGLNSSAAENEIRSAFSATLPQLPAPKIYTVAGLFAEATQVERSAATLLGLISLVPLLLALSGIFGVVSFSVGQRSHEFGIRIALGAQAHHILTDVLRRALSMTAIGVAIGTVLAALGARAIAPLISISTLDPLTFGLVGGLVVVAAVVAAVIPAIRATSVDPVVALRYDA